VSDPHPSTAALATSDAAHLARQLAAGTLTSVALVTALLDRIAAVDSTDGDGPGIGSVLAVAADALEQARRLDRERAEGQIRGPLHGLPVLVKDNIEVVGLPGTAGSFALADRPVTTDAPLVTALRSAGLVVLGSTNLSEWANMRSIRSTSGWSAVGGLTVNPWALDRSAGGSSSGSGAALSAGLAPLAIGTETDGSITCPASFTGVVGLKPTHGLVPTEGVVPLASSQDAAGPMARTVADVAALLVALTGDPSYAVDAEPISLAGVRAAVADGWRTLHPQTDAVFDDVLGALADAGADLARAEVRPIGDVGAHELTVLLAELKDDLDSYLAARPGAGPSSLAEVVAFNRDHAGTELAHFGQDWLELAVAGDGRADPAYAQARARCLAWSVEEMLEPAFSLDGGREVLLAPAYAPAGKIDLVGGDHYLGGGVASPAPSMAGWPVLCLPMGLVGGLPVGLAIIARPHHEARLLAVGHAVEAVLGLRSAGRLTPTWLPPRRG
jgi:amidase